MSPCDICLEIMLYFEVYHELSLPFDFFTIPTIKLIKNGNNINPSMHFYFFVIEMVMV